MNDQLAYELIGELHNINLNLIELTKAIKSNNSNIDLESLFSNTVSSYSICDECIYNCGDHCSEYPDSTSFKKCTACAKYINDAVYRPILPEGVDQI